MVFHCEFSIFKVFAASDNFAALEWHGSSIMLVVRDGALLAFGKPILMVLVLVFSSLELCVHEGN